MGIKDETVGGSKIRLMHRICVWEFRSADPFVNVYNYQVGSPGRVAYRTSRIMHVGKIWTALLNGDTFNRKSVPHGSVSV